MLELFKAIPFSFGALFPVVNPLGSAMIFLILTAGLSEAEHRKLAWKVAVNTFLLLVIVLFTGSWVLQFFGISIPIVEIGGGSVVAYIGWTLLNRPSSAEKTTPSNGEKEAGDMAFFPLTMPMTAGPGAIAVTLTVGARQVSQTLMVTLMAQLGVLIGIALVAMTVFLCYSYANTLIRKLGASGTEVIMRLAAFINLCIGLEIMWHGIQALGLL